MSFLVDINPEMELPTYDMVLCKLNEEPLMTITNIRRLVYKPQFAAVSELTFEVPFYRSTHTGKKVKNERYDFINGDMLIELNKKDFFYIHYTQEKVDENGEVYKEVQAYSREYELTQKKVMGYERDDCVIYELPTGSEEDLQDENGMYKGYLNYVESVSSWRVGYVDVDIGNKQRIISFSDTNILQSFQEIQKSFGCLLQFDTRKKIINVYKAEDFESDLGFHISDKNYLRSLEKTISADEIKTRLYLYGHENVSIQSLSITGKPYIEDFSFYKNTDYMSQELIDALDKYDEVIAREEPLFQNYLSQLEPLNETWRKESDKLIEIVSDLTEMKVMFDIILARPYPSKEERDEALDEKREEIAEQEKKEKEQREIVNKAKERLEKVYNLIGELRKRIEEAGDFGKKLAFELDSFIREDTFSNSDYKEDSLEELLEEGHKILSRISRPVLQFNVSIVDFLNLVECQHDWKKMRLGDTVRLFHKDINFDYQVRLVGFTHTPEDGNLELHLSSTGTLDDPNLYLRDLLEGMNNTSSDVDFSKYKWDKGEQADLKIEDYVNNNFDLSKQALEAADGQKVLLDHRGYWGVALDENGNESPEKMRMTNNLIAMTKDDWETIDVAISPSLGVNATMLNGKIGNLATINANQIFITDDVDDSDLAQFIRENGGKTYNQPTPPDVVGNSVDPEISLSDGSLWLKGKNGSVDAVYRYNSSETYEWGEIGDYEGECHWEEVTDLALKGKDYNGAQITDEGIVAKANGVTINKDGVVVKNTKNFIEVATRMSKDGFRIYKDNDKVFEVNSEGVLTMRANDKTYLEMTGSSIVLKGGTGEIKVDSSGISLPAASSLKIGTNSSSNSYINISTNGVQFGSDDNGFFYNTSNGNLTIGGTSGLYYNRSSNKLTIGGDNGLKYQNRTLYIGGEEIARLNDIYDIYDELDYLAGLVHNNQRIPAKVVFG